MTEIPEHLLKRSRERRAALGLPTEGGEAPASSAAGEPARTPAPPRRPRRPRRGRRAGRPARRPPSPPRRRPSPTRRTSRPPSAAARSRSGPCPCWPSCPSGPSCTPAACEPPDQDARRPARPRAGQVFASKCSSCHGAGGEGGVGYPLAERRRSCRRSRTLEDQVAFVTRAARSTPGKPYGDPNRPGGPHIGRPATATAMPSFEEHADPGRDPRRRVPRALRRSAAATRRASRVRSTGARPTRPNFAAVEAGGFAGADIRHRADGYRWRQP